MAGKPAKIATLDLAPGITVGVLRHNGFLQGLRPGGADARRRTRQAPPRSCAGRQHGDQAKGQTAMENCLQKNPDINLVYTINEPAARRRVHRAEGGGQGEGRADRLGRRRLRRRRRRAGRHDRRDLAAVPAEDGGAWASRPVVDYAKSGKKASRLHRHRRHADHRQAAGRRRQQGHQVRPANCWGTSNVMDALALGPTTEPRHRRRPPSTASTPRRRRTAARNLLGQRSVAALGPLARSAARLRLLRHRRPTAS